MERRRREGRGGERSQSALGLRSGKWVRREGMRRREMDRLEVGEVRKPA